MINQVICATAAVCVLLKGLPEFNQLKSQRQFMSQQQEIALARECAAMNAEGKITDLMAELFRLTDELSDLRDKKPSRRTVDRIHEIQVRVHDIAERSRSILRPEWTEDKWPYKAKWEIKFSDVLNIDERIIATNFAFEDFELEGFTLGGKEREELYPLVAVHPDSQVLEVTIEKEANSLELCQMQPTLGLIGTIKYRFQNEVYSDDINLTLRPGTYRLPEPEPEQPPVNWPGLQPPKPRPSPVPQIPPDLLCEILRDCPDVPPVPYPWPQPGQGPRPRPTPIDAVPPRPTPIGGIHPPREILP